MELEEQVLKQLKEDHKGLKEEHKDFIELLKETNKKLDRLVEIMEESRVKPTDSAM
jgi:hypothetical protein